MGGGYPSGCNRRRLLKGTEVRRLLRDGVMPHGLDELHGETMVLDAKPPLFDLEENDAYEWGPTAGGGWGDPIEREPEYVADDVRHAAVSRDAALGIYGVAVDSECRVDEARTRARRVVIREERCSWPKPKSIAQPAGLLTGEAIATCGDDMDVVRVGNTAFWVCGCSHAIAPADENWKDYALQGLATAAELGPRVSLHAELEAVRYACPSCTRLLDVEIRLKGDAPLFDVEIAARRTA